MKILLIGNFDPATGGPSNVMRGLKEYFDKSDDDVKIDCMDIGKISLKNYFKIIIETNILDKRFLDSDIIHFHELWNPIILFLITKAEKLSIPYLFTFHGVLNNWSLKKKNFVKKIYLKIFKKKIFYKTNAFNFLTKYEFFEAEYLYPNFFKKSFILQNGIDLSRYESDKNFKKNNKLKLIFFGRKHPKKGLDVLIKTFSIIKKNKSNITLKIVGPNSLYENELKNLIKKYSLNDIIELEGPEYLIEKKNKLFSEHHFLILPSYDEADSLVLKESLSFGLPIIITRGCKFADVEKEKIGYFINHNPHEIYNKLISLTNNKNSFDDLYYNCKNFANENFNISSIGPTYKENLKEIISGVQYSSNWLKTNKNIK